MEVTTGIDLIVVDHEGITKGDGGKILRITVPYRAGSLFVRKSKTKELRAINVQSIAITDFSSMYSSSPS